MPNLRSCVTGPINRAHEIYSLIARSTRLLVVRNDKPHHSMENIVGVASSHLLPIQQQTSHSVLTPENVERMVIVAALLSTIVDHSMLCARGPV